jgi:Ca2+/Na+ antiporter
MCAGLLIIIAISGLFRELGPDGVYAAQSRQLSSYPDDIFGISRPYREAPSSEKARIILHVILLGYMLLGLNTVCDVYFTGSLEVMVEMWSIKPDVAGATFMAAGGSAPELFTSLIGAIVTQDDVGFGTIVGSAVFNVLFVIGLCGFLAKDAIALTWYPLFRDCFCYIIGLSMLAMVASDGWVKLWEAMLLFVGYLSYCVLMYNNTKFETLTDFEFQKAKRERCHGQQEPMSVVPGRPLQPDVGGTDGETSDDSIEQITIPGTSEAPIHDVNAIKSETKISHHLSESSNSCDAKRVAPAPINSGVPHGTHGRRKTSTYLTQASNQRHSVRMASLGRISPPNVDGPLEKDCQEDDAPEQGENASKDEEEDGDLMEKPEGMVDRSSWRRDWNPKLHHGAHVSCCRHFYSRCCVFRRSGPHGRG